MDINDEFYNNYYNNIENLIKLRDEISGTHEIDINKANLWINSQLNERRRNASKFLIENTYYITFNQLFENIRDAVKQIYLDLDLTKDIYIFVQNSKSSFYFIGMIALYFIKLFKYK